MAPPRVRGCRLPGAHQHILIRSSVLETLCWANSDLVPAVSLQISTSPTTGIACCWHLPGVLHVAAFFGPVQLHVHGAVQICLQNPLCPAGLCRGHRQFMHACNHCRLAVRHTALTRCALLSPFCWGAFEQHMRLTGLIMF